MAIGPSLSDAYARYLPSGDHVGVALAQAVSVSATACARSSSPTAGSSDEYDVAAVRRELGAQDAGGRLLLGRVEVVGLHRIGRTVERHLAENGTVLTEPLERLRADVAVRGVDQRVVGRPASRERKYVLVAGYRVSVDEQLRECALVSSSV